MFTHIDSNDSDRLQFIVDGTCCCGPTPPTELQRLKRCPAAHQGKAEKSLTLCGKTELCSTPLVWWSYDISSSADTNMFEQCISEERIRL